MTFGSDLDSLEACCAAGAITFWKTLSDALIWMAWQCRHFPKMLLLTYGLNPNCQKITPGEAREVSKVHCKRSVYKEHVIPQISQGPIKILLKLEHWLFYWKSKTSYIGRL